MALPKLPSEELKSAFAVASALAKYCADSLVLPADFFNPAFAAPLQIQATPPQIETAAQPEEGYALFCVSCGHAFGK